MVLAVFLWALTLGLAAEAVLRLAYYLKKRRFYLLAPMDWGVQDSKRNAYLSHPYFSYGKKPNLDSGRYPTNSSGYAGKREVLARKPEGTFRILVCGGSTVEQNDVDQESPFDPELTWPSLLERLLNRSEPPLKVEVVNAGCSGYTSVESLIDLQLRSLHLKPDMAVFYHGINDAWLSQSVAGFRPDYAHSRMTVVFPERELLPDLRASFLYQYLKKKLLAKTERPGLLHFMCKTLPFQSDLNDLPTKNAVFKTNARNFCAVCVANGIVPVLLPWYFAETLVRSPFGHTLSPQQIEQFRRLLEGNNRAVKEVSEEFSTAVYLDVGPFEPSHFRATDWLHFSRSGLQAMGERVALALQKGLHLENPK